MTPIYRSSLGVVLTALSALAVGCCDNEKKQITYLSGENLKLSDQIKDLQDQLTAARTRESQLISQVDAKQTEVDGLRTEVAMAKQRATAPTPAPGGGRTPLPPGAEVAVYKVTVGSDILFAAGKASLTAAGKARLGQIVSLLKSQYAGMGVRVYGYTDSDPIRKTKGMWADNLDLSANRAMAVTRYLISKGIRAADIETVGMGATHFVAGNSTKAGKAKNRRVLIMVVKR